MEKKYQEGEETRTEHNKQVGALIRQLRRQIETQQGTTKLHNRWALSGPDCQVYLSLHVPHPP
jgi:hypothetical protein